MVELKSEKERLELLQHIKDTYGNKIIIGTALSEIRSCLDDFITKEDIFNELFGLIKQNINNDSFENSLEDIDGTIYNFSCDSNKPYSYIISKYNANTGEKDEIKLNILGYIIEKKSSNNICFFRSIKDKSVMKSIIQEEITISNKKDLLSREQIELIQQYLEILSNDSDSLGKSSIQDTPFSRYDITYSTENRDDLVSFYNNEGLLEYRYRVILYKRAYINEKEYIEYSDLVLSIKDKKAKLEFAVSWYNNPEIPFFTACKISEFKRINPDFDFSELKEQIKIAAEHGVDISDIPIELQPQQEQEINITSDSRATGETPSTPGDDGSGYGDR